MTNLANDLSPLIKEGGKYDFDKYVALTGLKKSELKEITGLTELRSDRPLSQDNRNKLRSLTKILTYLIYEFQGNEEAVSHWIHSPRSQWFGDSPLDLMQRKDFETVENYLKRHCEPDMNMIKG